MFQGILILAFAPLIGVRLTVVTVAALIPTMFLTASALSSVGLLVAARMRTMEGFQMIMNFLMMPMFFLSGALFPLSNLPTWLTVLTRLNPVSYGVDAIRQIILSQAGVPSTVLQQFGITLWGHPVTVIEDLALVVVFAGVMTALAVRAFSVQD